MSLIRIRRISTIDTLLRLLSSRISEINSVPKLGDQLHKHVQRHREHLSRESRRLRSIVGRRHGHR